MMDAANLIGPGETVLWQGRPDAGLFVTPAQVARVIRVFIALILLGYIMARLGYGLPPLTDIRVIVILIFFQAVPLEIVKSAFLRKRSLYWLTDRRAIIAAQLPLFGSVVRSIPITAETPVILRAGRRLGSLYFGVAARRFWDLRGYAASDGFERIADPAGVLALVNQVQRRAA